MAAQHITPVEELTGLPLPFIPNPNLPPVVHENNTERIADWHHSIHPKRSPQLRGLGGQALRNSRVQWADYREHHDGYHEYFSGPPLPQTARQQFNATVMAIAGYIPEYGLDFSRSRPQVTRLDQSQRNILWESGQIRLGSLGIIKEFLSQFLVNQEIDFINMSMIDELLTTRDERRRRYLKNLLIALVIDNATEQSGLDKTYRKAYRNGQIRAPETKSRDLIKGTVAPNRHGITRLSDIILKRVPAGCAA